MEIVAGLKTYLSRVGEALVIDDPKALDAHSCDPF
jgi:hypothetical protein